MDWFADASQRHPARTALRHDGPQSIHPRPDARLFGGTEETEKGVGVLAVRPVFRIQQVGSFIQVQCSSGLSFGHFSGNLKLVDLPEF